MIGVGQTLKGRYRLEEEVGVGGMGVVYRAIDLASLPHRTYFAVKAIRAQYAADARYRERFEREFLAVRGIRSDHVITVFDRGTLDSGELFMVMEYVDAPNLARVVADHGPLDPALAIQLVAQIGAALSAAHRAGVIHRDVKPSNVMVQNLSGHPHIYLGDSDRERRRKGDAANTDKAGLTGCVGAGHQDGRRKWCSLRQLAHGLGGGRVKFPDLLLFPGVV